MRQVSGAFDPDILAIVRELKTYRMVMGITIREVARRTDVGFMTIHHWERENRMPDMINLRAWAEALGYRIKVTIEVPNE